MANPADLLNPRASKSGMSGQLYIGSMSALNPKWLKDNNIVAVFSMNGAKMPYVPGVQQYSYTVADARHEHVNLMRMMPEITSNMHRILMSKGNVLVHCHMGMQRAPTVGVHYLMRYYRMPQNVAIRWMRTVRPLAFANGYTFF